MSKKPTVYGPSGHGKSSPVLATMASGFGGMSISSGFGTRGATIGGRRSEFERLVEERGKASGDAMANVMIRLRSMYALPPATYLRIFGRTIPKALDQALWNFKHALKTWREGKEDDKPVISFEATTKTAAVFEEMISNLRTLLDTGAMPAVAPSYEKMTASARVEYAQVGQAAELFRAVIAYAARHVAHIRLSGFAFDAEIDNEMRGMVDYLEQAYSYFENYRDSSGRRLLGPVRLKELLDSIDAEVATLDEPSRAAMAAQTIRQTDPSTMDLMQKDRDLGFVGDVISQRRWKAGVDTGRTRPINQVHDSIILDPVANADWLQKMPSIADFDLTMGHEPEARARVFAIDAEVQLRAKDAQLSGRFHRNTMKEADSWAAFAARYTKNYSDYMASPKELRERISSAVGTNMSELEIRIAALLSKDRNKK